MPRIQLNDRECDAPEAFRAVWLLVAAKKNVGEHRIFKGVNGQPSQQFHPAEWIVPEAGSEWFTITYCVGPGGGDDARVAAIQRAIEAENEAETEWTG